LLLLAIAHWTVIDQPLQQAPVIIGTPPLNILQAGRVQRVLPGARFLFAERHACDVAPSGCLSNHP
jgi:hypothetical protein